MAKDILKEAIADAKAVREVALANAKAALEEAFTPKLQSMLSAKLSETLNEEEEEELDENVETVDEITGMDEDEETMEESENLDEEVDLEEILNELELEEGDDSEEETVDEAKDKEEETMDEAKDDEEIEEAVGKPNHRAEYVQDVMHKADDIHAGLNEGEEFDLDTLLEEINNLDEEEDLDEDYGAPKGLKSYARPTGDEPGGQRYSRNTGYNPEEGVEEGWFTSGKHAADTTTSDELRKYTPGGEKALSTWEEFQAKAKELGVHPDMYADTSQWKNFWHPGANDPRLAGRRREEGMYETLEKELEETKSALEVKTTELNEVNLLNSKLLYVNRIFKANNLDDAQKLRVVETLDKADCIKEAKLIYETIKDTFNVAKSKKASFKSKTKSLKEGIGMASKATGTSTAPKKEVISESNDMINRFQKLANIKINQ
jgi:hypothetical protein